MVANNHNPSQLLLFDIDGTLLWPNGIGRESTRAAMLEVFGTYAGLDEHRFGGKTDWFTLLELLSTEGYSAEDVERALPAFEAAMRRHIKRLTASIQVEPCPGALDIVRELHGRPDILLGIVTGNVSSTAPVKLRAAGFDPAWFAIGAYGSESPDRNRLPFLALERANALIERTLTAKHVTIIGDTPADVACARALGARAVAVKTGFSSEENLQASGPDYLLADLATLPQIISEQ